MNDRVEREVSRAHPLTRRQFIETIATGRTSPIFLTYPATLYPTAPHHRFRKC